MPALLGTGAIFLTKTAGLVVIGALDIYCPLQELKATRCFSLYGLVDGSIGVQIITTLPLEAVLGAACRDNW
jgi:hypothetical protein